ncbi:MAG: hypothetical protein ACXACP_13200 [Candidatus Hodarchaeales archaeon]|jgi:hypothetical protein
MPVCKNCHNYVMKLPCSHCGSDLSLDDRKDGDIQPIVPVEIQGDFSEAPPLSSAASQPSKPTPPLKSQTRRKASSTASSFQSSKSSSVSARTAPESSSDGTSGLIMATMDKRFSLIETNLKSIQKEVAELNKTQKVMEKVLIQISKELLKLRKS